MQTIEIKKGISVSTDEFMNSVSRLDAAALGALLEHVQKAMQLRNYSPIHERENQLLAEIRGVIPASVLRRFRQLRLKQQNGTIANKEQEELQLLADIIEEKSAQRVLLLGELAALRKVSLSELRKQFRLQDFYA